MMIYHDVITLHTNDVHGQHIHLHPLTIHIKFATTNHYLQLHYNPLQSAMWQNNNKFEIMFLNYILDFHHLFWMVLDHATWPNKNLPHDMLIEFWPKYI
jgi:hypothetical protein